MKRFLKKIAVWAFVLYILAWGLDYIISTGQTMMDGYPQQTWREIRTGSIDADAVILGTSRGLQHYDPAILDSVTGLRFYNLGMGGYAVNNNLMKFRCYCRHNRKPRYVIVDVDYIWFQIHEACQEHQSEQFLPLFYDKEARRDLLTMGYTWSDAYFPLYRYWGYQTQIKRGILSFLHIANYCEYPSYKGHMPDPGTWSMNNLHFPDSISGVMEVNAQRVFETFLRKCADSNIQVILATSPRYYHCTEKITHRAEERRYINSLCKQYKLQYWDFVTDYPMCHDSTMFNAGVHLTIEGTKKFSKDFGEKLKWVIESKNHETINSHNKLQ